MALLTSAVIVALAVAVPAAPASAAAPTVTALSPTSGPLHAAVTVTGTGFTAPATVSFNGAVTAANVVSSTKLTASVGQTASTGPVTVTTAGSTISAGTFTVTPSVLIASTTPSAGPPGSTVTLYGAGFTAGEAIDVYAQTTDQALVVATSSGSFALTGFTIPTSAKPGVFTITAIGRKSGSAAQVTFTVRTDWPQEGFNASHSSTNPYENILTAANVDNLTTAWTATMPDNAYDSGVVVAGGIAYAAADSGAVVAFDATTGTRKWTATPAATSSSSSFPPVPAVAGGVVYVSTANGSVSALNAATGATIWTEAIGKSGGPIVVSGSQVLVRQGQTLVALTASTGAVQWGYSRSVDISAGPIVSSGSILLGFADGQVIFLNSSGVVQYTNQLDGSGDRVSSIVASNGYFWASEDTVGIFKISRTFSRESKTSYTSSLLAASGSTLYSNNYTAAGGAQASATANQTSLDGVALTQKWANQTFSPVGAPSIANGVVYSPDYTSPLFSASDDTNLFAMDASTGARVGAASLSGTGYPSQPAITNGMVYLAAGNHTIVALGLPNMATNAKPTVSQLKPNTALRATKSAAISVRD